MRAITVLALALMIGLLVSGCAKTSAPEKEAAPQESQSAGSPDNSISGDISSVDSLDLELDSSELGDVDAQLNEINW
jgi:hypothetical protein